MPNNTSPTSALARFCITTLLGPVIGVLVFLLVIAADELAMRPTEVPDVLTDLWPVLVWGYMFGLVPAILGAVFMALVAWRVQRAGGQLIAAIPLGAVAGVLGLRGVLFGFGDIGLFDLSFDFTAAAAGATALLLTTMIHLRWTARGQRKSV